MNNNHTKGIAFKNFRRFIEFSMLDFGNITYMVGRNNSGKSTMVKALLLMLDYLKNQLSNTFSFDNQALEDANIVTFGRAKCNLIDEPEITFNLKLNTYNITIHISGEDDRTKANVNQFLILDEENGFNLTIDYNTERTRIIKNAVAKGEKVDTNQELLKLESEISTLKEKQNAVTNKGSKEALQLIDQINKLVERRNKLAHAHDTIKEEDNVEYNLEYPLNYQDESFDDPYGDHGDAYSSEEHLDDLAELDEETSDEDNTIPRTEDNELKEIISTFLYHNSVAYKKAIEQRNTQLNEVEDDTSSDIIELDNTQEELKDWIDELVKTIERETFYYLGANPSKQSALFQLRDKNNALAQAIHEFKQRDIGESTQEGMFVKKWMREFEVGHSYKIDFYAGEAYQFHVLEENGKVNHLSDKGMGSLQAMLLILRVASLIHSNKKDKKNITLLVEEPELNLHPHLQSKLSDFFHEVYDEYGFNFIVETHSEYMIRQAQYISLEMDYLSNPDVNPNPFSIFYFHKEEGPYQMKFKNDGKFERSFGDGFFNEADKLAMKTYKLNLKNKKNG